MKTINRHVSIAVLAAACVSFAASGEETYPTIAEIDAEIASLANKYGARTLWREFEATAGRIKDLQDKFPTQEVLQVQWHVVSNMFAECYPVAAVTNGNQVNYQGMEWIVRRHLLGAKVGFNQSVKRFRREVFNCFCTLILCEFVEYPEPVRQDLWEEFCRRSGASDDEKSEAYSERHVIRVSML